VPQFIPPPRLTPRPNFLPQVSIQKTSNKRRNLIVAQIGDTFYEHNFCQSLLVTWWRRQFIINSFADDAVFGGALNTLEGSADIQGVLDRGQQESS